MTATAKSVIQANVAVPSSAAFVNRSTNTTVAAFGSQRLDELTVSVDASQAHELAAALESLAAAVRASVK